jgi:hypothetical protein
MTIYTDAKQPDLKPENLGLWARLRRREPRGYTLTVENCVGGQMEFAFKTQRAAVLYAYKLQGMKPGLQLL